MKEKNVLAIGLVFLVILLGACRTTTSQSAAPAAQACAANFTSSGNVFTGRTVKSFQEYPNSAKNPTLTYLVTKLSSLAYQVVSTDRESGLISAEKPVPVLKQTGGKYTMNAMVTPLNPTGVRVELTLYSGVYGDINPVAARNEFCSILEGVPPDKPIAKATEPSKPAPVPPVVQPPSPPPTPPEPPIPPSPQPPLKKTTVIVAKENIREVPQGKIIGQVMQGTTLVVLEEKSQWLKVRLEGGTEAWIWKASTSGAK